MRSLLRTQPRLPVNRPFLEVVALFEKPEEFLPVARPQGRVVAFQVLDQRLNLKGEASRFIMNSSVHIPAFNFATRERSLNDPAENPLSF